MRLSRVGFQQGKPNIRREPRLRDQLVPFQAPISGTVWAPTDTCGQSKVWDKSPDAGAVPAKDVYRGAPFTVNRTFAEHFGDRWVILSAKYGFISPDFGIPGPYEVTFKRKNSSPVSVMTLRQQVREGSLHKFKDVIGLGGKDYRVAIEAAFMDAAAKLHFPFAGLRIGESMQAVNKAIAADNPFRRQSEAANPHA